MGGLSGLDILCVCQLHVQCFLATMVAIFSGPGRFTITSVTVGAGHDLINVTFVQVSKVICDDYGLLSTTTMNIFTC